jgi:site-specific DNA recombinase
MLAVFAEFEHATIVDRVSAGIERRAKEGRWYAGRPPFGYLFSDERRTLVPDPVKAPVVCRIFDFYTRKRLGTIAIANQLREDSAPAPAAGWGHSAVHWIISNPTYTGRIRWLDRVFDGVHEPLVDELTFNRAQAILRERGEESPVAAATPQTSCSPGSCAADAAARAAAGTPVWNRGPRQNRRRIPCCDDLCYVFLHISRPHPAACRANRTRPMPEPAYRSRAPVVVLC